MSKFFESEEALESHRKTHGLRPINNPYPDCWSYPKPRDEHRSCPGGSIPIYKSFGPSKDDIKKIVRTVKVPDWDKEGVIITYDDNTVRYYSLMFHHPPTQSAGRKARRSRRNRKKSKRTRRTAKY